MDKGLKPCPFCGSEAKLTNVFYDKTRIAVQCTKCNVRTDFYNSAQQAIAKWDARTTAKIML